MILSPNRSERGGRKVRLIIVHTAEGARTVQSLGNYFAKPEAQSSSHVGIDDDEIEQYVPYNQMAWTVRSGNPISENAELCGFAAWSRTEWLDNHSRMLDILATWLHDRCVANSIPIRKLTPAQVAAGQAGICGHVDWTIGMKDGSHTDPGNGFPWDIVIARANGNEDNMPLNDADKDWLAKNIREVIRGDIGWARSQIMTSLGFNPDTPPDKTVDPRKRPARAVDLAYVRDQIVTLLGSTNLTEPGTLSPILREIADKLDALAPKETPK